LWQNENFPVTGGVYQGRIVNDTNGIQGGLLHLASDSQFTNTYGAGTAYNPYDCESNGLYFQFTFTNVANTLVVNNNTILNGAATVNAPLNFESNVGFPGGFTCFMGSTFRGLATAPQIVLANPPDEISFDDSGGDIYDSILMSAGTSPKFALTFWNTNNTGMTAYIDQNSNLVSEGSFVVVSNAWNLVNATNGVPNFATVFTSSNGVPVWVYRSNNIAFPYYVGQAGSGGILP
jgi:hypothetical protein